MMNKKLISIHLNSNNSLNFEEFIFSIIENTTNIDSIEILVSIDLGDNLMKESIKKLIDTSELALNDLLNDTSQTIGNTLLTPTRIYVKLIHKLILLN